MYNKIGNIVSVTKYDYTPKGTEPSGSGVTESYTYSTTHPDRLTNHNGKVAMYNSMGCPISFNGMGATWTRGKLSQLSKGTFRTGSESFGFNYNAMGQRVTKTYNYTPPTTGLTQQIYGQVTQYSKAYHYDHTGRLIEESINETQYGMGVVQKSIKYLYDGNTVIGLQYNNGTNVNTYYYQRNLLGDVIAIYDANGIKVVEYVYDAFGNCTILANATSNYPLANDNPIRYRGYYYDADTNLYYLNSRYYSPEFRRFISPDDTAYLDSETPNGLNLYCYCNNDPVNHCDPSGCFSITAILIGAAIGFATSYLSDVIDNTKDGFEWSDFNTFEENWLKYIGSTLGGAIGGLGTGFASTLFCGGMGSVVEGLFTNDVSSIREAIISMAFGGLLSGIGYGFSKGIVKMFANRKITSILGNMSENIKVNKRLSQAGFGYLKIGKHGYKNIYEEIYDVLGYDTAQTIVSYGFDITIGLIF